VEIVSSTKNIPSAPSVVKALEQGHRRKGTNLDVLEDTLPRRLGIKDEFVPNAVFNPRFMPLFMVKHFVIAFNPNRPKGNASKEVPNFGLRAILIRDPFPKESLFPIEAIVVARVNPTKFMHDISSPPPCPPSLNTIPKFMLDRLASVRKAKNALL
jgi:hypothetical protein